MKQEAPSFAIITRSREDIEVIAQGLAHALMPVILENSDQAGRVLTVLIIGTQKSGKSIIPDKFAETLLPQEVQDQTLSYYGDSECAGEYREISGFSEAFGANIALSFEEFGTEIRFSNDNTPSVAFFQNTNIEDLGKRPDIIIALRLIDPENSINGLNEDEHEILFEAAEGLREAAINDEFPDIHLIGALNNFRPAISEDFPSDSLASKFMEAARNPDNPMPRFFQIAFPNSDLLASPSIQAFLNSFQILHAENKPPEPDCDDMPLP